MSFLQKISCVPDFRKISLVTTTLHLKMQTSFHPLSTNLISELGEIRYTRPLRNAVRQFWTEEINVYWRIFLPKNQSQFLPLFPHFLNDMNKTSYRRSRQKLIEGPWTVHRRKEWHVESEVPNGNFCVLRHRVCR